MLGNRIVARCAQIAPTAILGDVPDQGLVVGDNANIGPSSFIGRSGYIEIGARAPTGPRVNLRGENHSIEIANVPIKSQGVTLQVIFVQDACWLGVDGRVLAGVAVGDDTAAARDGVVTRGLRPYSPVDGVPARASRTSNLDEAIPSGAAGPALAAPLS